jgi:hypothetical protein
LTEPSKVNSAISELCEGSIIQITHSKYLRFLADKTVNKPYSCV